MSDIKLSERNLTVMICTIIFLALTIDSSAQNTQKHSISFELSPFTCFYEGISPFNTREALLNNASIPFIFRGRIRGSLGLNYGYKLNEKLWLRFGYTSFNATGYSKNNIQGNQWNLATRYYKTLNLDIYKTYQITSRIKAFLGAGPLFRFQRSILSYGSEQGHNVKFKDFGLNANFESQYSISKNWFTSLSINNSWITILGGKNQRAELKQIEGSVDHFFPRFSTSLKFGVGRLF